MRDKPLPSALAGQFRRDLRDEGQACRAWIIPAEFVESRQIPKFSRKPKLLKSFVYSGMLVSCWPELP